MTNNTTTTNKEIYNKTRPITSHDLIINATEEIHRDIDKLLGYALKIQSEGR